MTATREDDAPSSTAPADPLRLCVYTTISMMAWLIGPAVVVAFAVIGIAAYSASRRAGLTRSKCVLRDTRLVLAYLAAAAVAGLAGVAFQVARFVN